jgi:predicted nucleotidyltransferase
MKQETTDPVVREFRNRVRKTLGSRLVAIFWFGSRARGEGHDESDYDFLVATHAPIDAADRHAVSDISVGLAGKHRKVLDVHYADEARLEGRTNLLSPFRAHVLAEGIRL